MDNIDRINLSFSGCGFLGIYHVGVASCFLEYCPQITQQKISGASFGALVATAIACNLPLGESTTDILKVVIKARSRALGPFHPSFDVNRIVKEALMNSLPEDAHTRVNGRLHISVTRVSDGCNVILSNFESKQDLIQALLCSCFIPFWSGVVPPKYRGVAYMDGGFSVNLLVLDDDTITVSPFSGESDICPQDNTFNLLQFNLANTSISLSPGNMYRLTRVLFPPHPEIMRRMCQQGFDDALRFLQRTNRISCLRCVATKFYLSASQEQQPNQEKQISLTSVTRITSTTKPKRIRKTPTRPAIALSGATLVEEEKDEGVDLFEENNLEITVHEMFDDDDDCIDCQHRRQMAIFDSLPRPVARAIQDACDQVNKGVYNWIFNHRPMKILSLLTVPYVLPFDVAIVVSLKLWRKLPYLKDELVHSLCQLLDFTVKNIVDRINSNYSKINAINNVAKFAYHYPSEFSDSDTYSLINSRIIISR